MFQKCCLKFIKTHFSFLLTLIYCFKQQIKNLIVTSCEIVLKANQKIDINQVLEQFFI